MAEEPLPPLLALTLRTGTVYYFTHRNLYSAEPHYFVVANESPASHSVLLLAVASSQIGKVLARRRELPPETLVIIDPSEYPEFSKPTVIDCNQVFELPRAELIYKYKNRKLAHKLDLPKPVMEKIRKGILMSPRVDESHKKLVLPDI